MRVAALYDIHANLPALEAVLEDVRNAGAELIVVGGDVVPGPMPREALAGLLNLDVPVKFIYGNGEVALLDQISGREPAIPAQPKTVSLSIGGLGEVLFCHATPRNENEIFARLTPESRLMPAFAGVKASVVVCGHTHMQLDRMVGGVRALNAGSVGMPFGNAGADWLLLGPDVEFRHTDYDLAKTAERVRATNYPQAEEFAERYILNSPSEQEMLDVYARAELA